MKTILSLAAVAVLATSAIAGPAVEVVAPTKDFYIGGGIAAYTNYVDGQKDFFDDTADSEISGGLEAKAGYVFYRAGDFSAAIEGRVQDTMWSYFPTDANVDLLTYSVLVKPQYNFGDFGVYALAGYGASKISDDYDSYRETGFVWGGGANYAVTDFVEVFVDYTVNPAFKEDGYEDIENDVIALGVNYKF